MVYWNQNERNNIFVDGLDAAGEPKSPGYNMKLGFVDGTPLISSLRHYAGN